MFVIVICIVLSMCTLTIRSYVLCVLMVEGMSVVVNVMLSVSNECNEPTPCLVQPIGVHRTVVKLCTFGVFALRVSLLS